MWLFRRRSSDRWHRDIDATAIGKHPESSKMGGFPWIQLRLHTHQYLAKKSKLTPEDREARLVSLIQQHDAKDIAIAAAAHALPPGVVRDLLASEALGYFAEPGDCRWLAYLRAVLAARNEQPEAIGDVEARTTQVLIELSTVPEKTAHSQWEVVLSLFNKEGVTTDMLIYRQVYAMARFISSNLATRVEIELKSHGHWLQAFEETRWLVPILQVALEGGTSANPNAEQVLNNTFPFWQIWAGWNPRVERLLMWTAFTDEQRAKLRPLLALEGPDFVTSQATMWEGLSCQNSRPACSTIRRGDFALQLKTGTASEIREILQRLLDSISHASQVGMHSTDLLIHLCVEKPIDEEALQVLEVVRSMTDVSVSSAVLKVLSLPVGSKGTQMDSVMELLPILDTALGYGLRQILGPYFINHISAHIEGLQSDLSKYLRDGQPWTIKALMLIAIGDTVNNAGWLKTSLNIDLQSLLTRLPSSNVVLTLNAIRDDALSMDQTSLIAEINVYCMDRLVRSPGNDNIASNRLIETLVDLWPQVHEDSRRLLAFELISFTMNYDFDPPSPSTIDHVYQSVRRSTAEGSTPSSDAILCNCLAQIPALPSEFVRSCRDIFKCYSRGTDGASSACVDLARLLRDSANVASWRPVLGRMIEQQKPTLIEQTLTQLSPDSWFRWIENIVSIFNDVFGNPFSAPAIPTPVLYRWVRRLATSQCLATIAWLDENVGSTEAIHCLMAGGDGNEVLDEWLMKILDFFKKTGAGRFQPAMQGILALLVRDGSNATEVCTALSWIGRLSPDGEAAFVRVLELRKQASEEVAEAVLTGWLHSPELASEDQRALEALAVLLNISRDVQTPMPAAAMTAATTYFNKEMAELLEESRRLDGLRMALNAIDPDGVSAQLASLGIEAPSLADDALLLLPPALIDVVEKVGKRELEVQFPITHLTALQRAAMGVGDAQSLLVRIVLGDGSLSPGFCMHFDNQCLESIDTAVHSPWIMLSNTNAPNVHYCGSRANRTTYQLSRALYCHLQAGFTSLQDIHTFLTKSLKDHTSNCIVCGLPLYAKLRRSTTCGLSTSACSNLLSNSDIEVGLSDIRHDPAVVDLLLTMVYAAAVSNNQALLTGRLTGEHLKITGLVNKLSSMTEIQTGAISRSRDLIETIRAYDDATITMLSHICSDYRGFLTSASDHFRIPNMPGAHQFLLANAAPELEAAFAAHRTGHQPASRVLFHGTTMDRLYAILNQGLKVCSGTDLQRTGSAHGNGVYMAEEPKTAWIYSDNHLASTTGWKKAVYHNLRVILGCEFVGNSTSVAGNQGIHVIKDASRLMVRYIFLMPASTLAPLAAHLTPAMISAFASLR